LYGPIIFHKGCFQRISKYQALNATECQAEIAADGQTVWFGPYLPGRFVLGDPGARDASLHAIQACVPHQRILPAGVEKIEIFDTRPGKRFVRARERFRQGNTFVYDFEVSDTNGKVVERWSGLELRAVENLTRAGAWPRALVGPYLQRRLEELVASPCVRVAVEHTGAVRGSARQFDTTLFLSTGARAMGSDAAMANALGKPARIWRRPDGKPVTWERGGISAAHQEALTFAIAGKGEVGCDVEAVIERPETAWLDLLGKDRLELASRLPLANGERFSGSATRLWTCIECLRKAGMPANAPLVFEAAAEDGWVLLRSGTILIATCVLAIQDVNEPLAFAIAFRPEATGSRPELIDPLQGRGGVKAAKKSEIRMTND
jgi:enediyne polyketide synthase